MNTVITQIHRYLQQLFITKKSAHLWKHNQVQNLNKSSKTSLKMIFLAFHLKEESSLSSSADSFKTQCASSYPPPSFFPPPSLAPSCFIPPSLRCHGNTSYCLAFCSALSSRWALFCWVFLCSCVPRQRRTSPCFSDVFLFLTEPHGRLIK